MQPLVDRCEPARIGLDAVEIALELERRLAHLALAAPADARPAPQRRVDALERVEPARRLGEQIRGAGRVVAWGSPARSPSAARPPPAGDPRGRAARARPEAPPPASGSSFASSISRTWNERKSCRRARSWASARSRASSSSSARNASKPSATAARSSRSPPERSSSQPCISGRSSACESCWLEISMRPRKSSASVADGQELPGDASPAAPAARHAALHDQLVPVAREPPLLESRLEVGQPLGAEHRLDARRVGAVADRLRRRTRTGQQRQRTEHDRLAGARLAGQHVQAGPELELGPLDDREVLDPQGLDQRSPQRSLARITSKRFRSEGTRSRAGCSERLTVTMSSSSSARPTWPSTVR